jgi:phosphoglucosamine mutase
MANKKKLFGTDGIRGKANIYPMTSEVAMNLGRAVAHYFQKNSNNEKQPLIILGKDTRLSCYMLELAFSAGVCSQGGRVILTGPLPTPGVAFAVTNMRANAGVMISASHNPYYDNGIKIFDQKGKKLPDKVELELEKMVLNPELISYPPGEQMGRAERLDEVLGRYIVHVKATLDAGLDLTGVRLVLDCANGASYKVAPMVFRELGAEVMTLGIEPNGKNINLGVGSLHPEKAMERVVKYRADLGICLDGDADRIISVDNKGQIIEGDILIGLMAKYLLDKGIIKKGDEVVGTLMSNLGLENFILSMGLKFYRANVGDRYILERMAQSGSIIGGEPSGHIIWGQKSQTGDGILAGLKLLEIKQYYNKPIDEIVKIFELYPQKTINLPVSKKPDLNKNKNISNEIQAQEKILGQRGRTLLRYSGTEPLVRVMVEAESEQLLNDSLNSLVEVVSSELS